MLLIRDIRKTEGQKQYKDEAVRGEESRINKDDEGWRQEVEDENQGQRSEGMLGKNRVGLEGKGCQYKEKGKK